MKTHENVKRTSVYIPPELAAKVKQSAMVHRRSFNQELLWLAEQGLTVVGTGNSSKQGRE